jgi:aspartyl protease family protein
MGNQTKQWLSFCGALIKVPLMTLACLSITITSMVFALQSKVVTQSLAANVQAVTVVAQAATKASQVNTDTSEDEIQVIGLFKNAALIRYAGEEKLFRVGELVSPSIKLLSASTKKARFMIDGKLVELKLSHHFKLKNDADDTQANSSNLGADSNASDNNSTKNIAKIVRGNNGMYQTLGFINGRGVKFLVDTGASQVAVNESVANLVGVDYKNKGQRVMVSTAAGSAKAWRVTFAKVKVGNIELHNVDGMVLKGTGPTEVLLGMSFLRQLKMSDDGQTLTLVKKY